MPFVHGDLGVSISPVAAEHLIIGFCFPFPCGPCCPLAGARGCPAMRVGKFFIPTVCSESVLNSHLFFPYFLPHFCVAEEGEMC